MVIMNLKLVKVKTVDDAGVAANGTAHGGDVDHGTKVIKQLVNTWSVKLDIVVAADSQFSSVRSKKSLEEMDIGFFSVVKQA